MDADRAENTFRPFRWSTSGSNPVSFEMMWKNQQLLSLVFRQALEHGEKELAVEQGDEIFGCKNPRLVGEAVRGHEEGFLDLLMRHHPTQFPHRLDADGLVPCLALHDRGAALQIRSLLKKANVDTAIGPEARRLGPDSLPTIELAAQLLEALPLDVVDNFPGPGSRTLAGGAGRRGLARVPCLVQFGRKGVGGGGGRLAPSACGESGWHGRCGRRLLQVAHELLPNSAAINQARGLSSPTSDPSTLLPPKRAGITKETARTHAADIPADTLQSDVLAISIRPSARLDFR